MKLKNSIIAIAALSSMSFAGGDIGGVTTFENNDMVNAEVEAVEPEISSLPEVEATPTPEATPEATPAPVVTKAPPVKETPQVEKTSSKVGPYVG
ncbi:MAG TPA: hypothetical protein ENK99_07150, partial [Campylobacterales bacterium]|nr:hypothetical protein [Campylobacterales bacterium]